MCNIIMTVCNITRCVCNIVDSQACFAVLDLQQHGDLAPCLEQHACLPLVPHAAQGQGTRCQRLVILVEAVVVVGKWWWQHNGGGNGGEGAYSQGRASCFKHKKLCVVAHVHSDGAHLHNDVAYSIMMLPTCHASIMRLPTCHARMIMSHT